MDHEKHSKILTTVKSYGKGLLRFIRKRVSSDADAEDILQDVWYQLSSIINTQPVEQVGAWLYRVASNKIVDKHRKKTELPWMDVEDEELSLYDNILMTQDTPETIYQDRIFWQELFNALDELPVAQKDVFIWHELDRIPFDEISKRTGEPKGKLISRKHYAVLHLRKRLQGFYTG